MTTKYPWHHPGVLLATLCLLLGGLAACSKYEEAAPASAPMSASVPTPVAAPGPTQEESRQAEESRRMEEMARRETFKKAKKTEPPELARAPASTATAPAGTTGPVPAAPKAALDSYSVSVSANERLQLPGASGEMRVWIGDPRFVPAKEEGHSRRTEPLGVTGTTAKVEPFVLGKISVEPAASRCGKIVPSGSEFVFKLVPHDSGSFTVGAKVEIYDSPDCTGSPTPKATKSIQVEVVVCTLCFVTEKLGELAARAWQAFLEFWDKLLLVFFALLLFLVRKKLYRWFGFKSE